MKKILLILTTVLFYSNILYSQIDDLTLAQKLIMAHNREVDSILKSYKLEYFVTYSDNNSMILFIAKDNGFARRFTLKFSDLKGKPEGLLVTIDTGLCTEVLIKYNHFSVTDLRDFYSLKIPNDDKIKYEKSLGELTSHLKLTREL